MIKPGARMSASAKFAPANEIYSRMREVRFFSHFDRFVICEKCYKLNFALPIAHSRAKIYEPRTH
jgi:hypothetical protein